MKMNNSPDLRYTFKENIVFVINKYKENFQQVAPKEQFKWEAIGWYKSHWDIEAEDFASMLKESFKKLGGLITSGNYYPYKMLVVCAEEDPERVRNLFRVLYDETKPLDTRYKTFSSSFQQHIEKLRNTYAEHKKAQNHYQDYRAIMVYLTCEYPEKYFFYKWGMYKDFRDRTNYKEEKHKNTPLGSVLNYMEMSEQVLKEVEKDKELLDLCNTRLNDICYRDEQHHLLTMEIIWYGASYLKEEVFLPDYRERDEYWPSLEDYNPNLSVDQWKEILKDSSICNASLIDMLQHMIDLGGEATCSKLAEIYGNTYRHYNMLGSAFAAKVKDKYDCPDCILPDEDNVEEAKVYVIPFLGRYVTENGLKRYSWKMRDELKEAFMDMYDTSNILTDSKTDVELNTILYGPPGTGKTYHTVIYAVAIIENKPLADVACEDYTDVLERYNSYKRKGRIEFTTFHQSYGYEEFIEGIKPEIRSDQDDEAGNIIYSVQAGIFKKFCEKAERSEMTVDYSTDVPSRKKENYVFIIDEINRGNISKIFGEIITLVEDSKRKNKREAIEAILPYSQEPFGIPDNVYIIGTMNTADRSIAAIDTALRRRFNFREMLPDPKVLDDVLVEDLSISNMLSRMNKRIQILFDREHTIGHAYFIELKKNPCVEVLAKIFKKNIIPLLQEYFYEDYEKIRLILADNQKENEEEQFIIAKPSDDEDLFGDTDMDFEEEQIYVINEKAFDTIESYRTI